MILARMLLPNWICLSFWWWIVLLLRAFCLPSPAVGSSVILQLLETDLECFPTFQVIELELIFSKKIRRATHAQFYAWVEMETRLGKNFIEDLSFSCLVTTILQFKISCSMFVLSSQSSLVLFFFF